MLRHAFIPILVGLYASTSMATERVAVLEFVANPSNAAGQVVLSSITDEVRRAAVDVLPASQYSVITRENQDMVLRENGVDAQALCDASCEVDLARTIGAALLVTGTINKIGSRLSLHVKLFQAERGQVLKIVKVMAKTEGEVYDLAYAEAVTMFREGLGIPDPKSAPQSATAPTSSSTDATAPSATTAIPSAAASGARVRFETSPPGAVVIVDGTRVCTTTPCTVMVPRQQIAIRFERSDHMPQDVSMRAVDGAVVHETLKANFGTLVFDEDQRDLIELLELDGATVALSSTTLRVSPGVHRLVVPDTDCLAGTTKDVDIKADETVNVGELLKEKTQLVDVRAFIGEKRTTAVSAVVADELVPLGIEPITLPVCDADVVVVHASGHEVYAPIAEPKIDGMNATAEAKFSVDIFRESSTMVMVWNAANIVTGIIGVLGSLAIALPALYLMVATGGLLAGYAQRGEWTTAGIAASLIGGTVAVGASVFALSVSGVIWGASSILDGNHAGTPSVGPACVPCGPLGIWMLFDEGEPIPE